MNKIINILLLLVLLVVSAFFAYYFYQKKQIEKLEIQLNELLQTQTPFKFKIEERKNDSLFIKIKYYSLDSLQISEKDYKLKGEELAFDFYVFERKGNYFAFPHKIFTDKIAPKYGFFIAKDYEKNNFPAIFSFKNVNEKDFEFLTKKYHEILDRNITYNNDFGNAVHDIKELKQFEKGVVYKILVHNKGGIEIVED